MGVYSKWVLGFGEDSQQWRRVFDAWVESAPGVVNWGS